MDARSIRLLSALVASSLLCGSLAGCTSLGKTSLWGQQAEVVKKEAAFDSQSPAPAGKYVIEYRDASGRGSSSDFTLAGPINIHEALQQAGAIKKFNRIKIELVRPLPAGGWHRMPIEYDRGIRRVPAECDYAVLPGDRLIVTEDTGNMVTDMMESAKEGMFLSNPKSGKTKNGTFRIAG
jgi:hypothetical protein